MNKGETQSTSRKAAVATPNDWSATTESFQRAMQLYRQGQLPQSEALCRQILQAQSEHADALYLLGMMALQRRETLHGADLVRRSLQINPIQPAAYVNLGLALLELKRPAEALPSFENALRLEPGFALGHYHLGNTLLALRRPGEALASFDRALELTPKTAEILIDRGNALQELKRYEEAVASYDRALELGPDSAVTYNNRGNALKALRRHGEALTCFDRALGLEPGYIVAFNNKGNVLQELLRHAEAAACFGKVVASAPDFEGALGAMLYSKLHCCEWSGYEQNTRRVVELVTQNRRVGVPFFFLAVSDSAPAQLQCARRFVADRHPSAATPVWRGERYAHDRIRVAYLSADFHAHPTAYLMAQLFERHDRKRFEITAISFGPEDGSAMRARLRRAFDRFIDVRSMSDAAVAQLLRELEIDIAVDLKGFTIDSRLEIFAHRAAPIHVNYLGYPGTLGAPYIDYIVADREVIPPTDQEHYTEQVVYLPDCYQVNDSTRAIAARTPERTEVGLPATGFVFCCFNNNYKITPVVFDVWMRLLRQVPGSVLWLFQASEVAASNLRREAGQRGVQPQRLVFAPPLPQEEHLARQRLADLFLDTLPVNAHTTASDALWAGLPVLTCRGQAFAGRVAGSLLKAVGLPQLVTESLAEYEQRALELATNPTLLARIRAQLAASRSHSPLFDTARFCRNLESAYLTMWHRYQRGEAPESFAVEPLDPAVPASSTPEPTGQPTPADNTARFAHALALQRAGQTAQAQAVCEQILQLEPHHAGALHLLGLLAVNHGNRERGIELFRESLAANPNQPVAHSNLAAVLLQMNRPGEALASCDQALRLNPNTILALYNRGNILRELKRPDEAVASYERALRLKPDYVSALKNCGIALVELRRYEDALAMFERALKLSPGNAEAYNSHGNTLLVLQRYEEALASYQRALALEPDFAEALNSTSNILGALKRHEEVLVYFSKLLEIAPGYKYAAGSMLHTRLHCCDWEGYSQDTKHLIASIAAGKQVELPFPFLAISDRASEQLQCARLFATERGGAAAAPLWQGEHYTHERIRVAYLSADFREHAVSYLMAGVLEQHDRTRFETIAVSLRTEEPTPMGQRVKRACDRFVDVSRLSDAQIAAQLREWEVDIVVDLVGFTDGVRTGILAQRPAPLQVSYLGFPATMGATYIDYILADEFVIPAAQRAHYAEQVVYLPECFQANDDRRAIEHTLSRAQCGLPESAAVLCCFNNSFKLSPGVFEIWLRLLQAVPDSVLWLLGDTEAVQRNLRAYASAHGLSADRLVFAPRLPYAQHLGRMSLADLFLDTLPFNAGTTASDALWAGVPVLTCTGEAFAARMAGSMLTAVGLPQLITHSLPEYEQRAMELLQRPELLADLRATLARHRNTHPLFNTSRFCRHLESAYLTMWQQYQRGERPEGFTVAPLDPAVSNPS